MILHVTRVHILFVHLSFSWMRTCISQSARPKKKLWRISRTGNKTRPFESIPPKSLPLGYFWDATFVQIPQLQPTALITVAAAVPSLLFSCCSFDSRFMPFPCRLPIIRQRATGYHSPLPELPRTSALGRRSSISWQ